jgi:hypothetical protein
MLMYYCSGNILEVAVVCQQCSGSVLLDFDIFKFIGFGVLAV